MSCSEKLVAFCAITVSLCALIVSIYQTRIISKDKDAAVWPYVRTSTSWSNDRFILSVSNEGIGPALIQSVKYELGDSTYYKVQDVLSHIDHRLPQGTPITYSNIEQKGHALRAGESTDIIAIKNIPGLLDSIHDYIQESTIEIVYCSVYDRCWVNLDNEINEH